MIPQITAPRAGTELPAVTSGETLGLNNVARAASQLGEEILKQRRAAERASAFASMTSDIQTAHDAFAKTHDAPAYLNRLGAISDAAKAGHDPALYEHATSALAIGHGIVTQYTIKQSAETVLTAADSVATSAMRHYAPAGTPEAVTQDAAINTQSAALVPSFGPAKAKVWSDSQHNKLALGRAEMMLSTDPSGLLPELRGGLYPALTSNQRAVLIRQADAKLKARANTGNYALRAAFRNAIAQASTTGNVQDQSIYNVSAEGSRERKQIIDTGRLAIASAMEGHDEMQMALNQPAAEASHTISSLPDTTAYQIQVKTHAQNALASQLQKRMRDPATAAAEALAPGLAATPENLDGVYDHWKIPEGGREYLTNTQAHATVAAFNAGTVDEQIATINQLREEPIYGEALGKQLLASGLPAYARLLGNATPQAASVMHGLSKAKATLAKLLQASSDGTTPKLAREAAAAAMSPYLDSLKPSERLYAEKHYVDLVAMYTASQGGNPDRAVSQMFPFVYQGTLRGRSGESQESLNLEAKNGRAWFVKKYPNEGLTLTGHALLYRDAASGGIEMYVGGVPLRDPKTNKVIIAPHVWPASLSGTIAKGAL